MNPISSAASGLIAASNRFDQASIAVSDTAAGGPGDLATAITDQISAKIQFQAEAKLVQSVNQTTKDVLNILV